MTLTLRRIDFREDGIFSELLNEKGRIIAKTLEHSFDGKPKIYDGKFKCVRGEHQLDHGPKLITFEVTGVKGHSGILWHIGNYNKNSDGCILLGEGIAYAGNGQKMVTNSRIAFQEFMDLMKGVDSFDLIVE